jgi:CubicO group peptidase (beta-lactamase class C family)
MLNMIRTLSVVLAAASLLAAADPLPRSAPETVGLSAATLREATTLLNQFVADRKIAGAVAGVARKGKVAYLEAFGVQDLQTRAPMTDRSLFRIYSMTKSFTSVAAMILHEEGRFGLKDPVSKYLPEFRQVSVLASPDGTTRAPAREITVEDLMLHTSGLNHRTSEAYRAAKVRSRTMTLPQFIGNLVRVPLMEDPGTRYRYSEGTTVLGRLVEIWSGKPFDVFMTERVIRPLKLVDTAFWAEPDRRARLTTVYAPAPGGGLTPVELEDVPFSERPALLEGAVGLLSTVPDYLRFAQMLLNKGELDGVRLLSARTVELITSNGLSPAVLQSRGGPMGWGLANVNVLLDPARSSPPANKGEYGWDGSAGTIFWVDPSTEMVTVLMTQSSPANPDGVRQKFKTIVQQAIVK